MSQVDEMYQEAEKLKDDGKVDDAISRLGALLEIEETHVLSHLALAVLYGRVGKHEEAVQHAQRACEIEPTDAFNFRALSVTYQRAFEGTRNQQFIPLAEAAMQHAQEMGV